MKLVVLALAILALVAADGPACDSGVCQNGGTCPNKQCVCPHGWTGRYCDTVCDPAAGCHAMDIAYRSYSGAATMGPMSEAFAKAFQSLTTNVLGANSELHFISLGTATIPSQFANVFAAVEAGAANGGYDAAYISGGDLNKLWGFLYNSGFPYGPTFDEFMAFLYGKSVAGGTMTGLELIRSIYATHNKNLMVVPVVASSEQVSGYFKKPLGDVPGMPGIGLAGLCQENWYLRYLPPAENVLGLACDKLVAEGVIPVKNLKFKAAVPGSGNLLDGIINGDIQGFEFATPLDDQSQKYFQPLPTPNIGSVGNRFFHHPAWQQEFLLTYFLINKDIYNLFTPQQKALLESAARDNVLLSWSESLRRQGDSWATIFNLNKNDNNASNDMVPTQWPAADQQRLIAVTLDYLDSLTTNTAYTAEDRADYTTILEAMLNYIHTMEPYYKRRSVLPQSRYTGFFPQDACTIGSYVWKSVEDPNGFRSQCVKCGFGTYNDEAGATTCPLCAVGTYTNTLGSTVCTQCATGNVAPVGSDHCTPCDAGTFAFNQEKCLACLKGTYSSEPAQTTCTPCAAGTYAAEMQSTTCTQCAPGTFAAYPGRWKCTSCAKNTIAVNPGSTECTPCPKHTKSNEDHTACIPKH